MTLQSRSRTARVGPDEREDRDPRRVVAVLGWALVAFLLVVVAALTVVAAAMVLVVSVWLTVAVPVVVLLTLVGIVTFARRAV